jgi:uncharacterized protein YkwD
MRPTNGALTALLITAAAIAPTTADAAPRTDPVERAVVKQLNGIRAQSGLPRLSVDRRLAKAADAHSVDMVRSQFFAHESSDGTPFGERIKQFTRKQATGETLAYLGKRQKRKAATVVSMWMQSPGHRDALMTREFRRIGVAKRTGTINGQPSAVFTADLSTPR